MSDYRMALLQNLSSMSKLELKMYCYISLNSWDPATLEEIENALLCEYDNKTLVQALDTLVSLGVLVTVETHSGQPGEDEYKVKQGWCTTWDYDEYE